MRIQLFILVVILAAAVAVVRAGTAETNLPRLKVEGAQIVDGAGRPVTLQGLNICSPAWMKQTGHWNEGLFKKMADWGADLVRVPIGPGSFRSTGAEGTYALLDDAVRWSKKYGMYVIVDWATIGNPIEKVWQPPWENEMRTTQEEMMGFWATVADRYRDEPAVAFYEVFNEPCAMSFLGGHLTWAQWRDFIDPVVDVVYAHNPQAIPLVAGLNWAYDFRNVEEEPLRNQNIVFAVHPYPGRAGKPWEEKWERDFGYLAEKHPVMITEFGFDPKEPSFGGAFMADAEYGRHILAFADRHGMSWTAFFFGNSPGWPMPLVKDWDYTPTPSGKLFRKALGMHKKARTKKRI